MDKTIEPGNHPELERKINTLDRMLVRHGRAAGPARRRALCEEERASSG